ncbi:MAG: sulfatase [Rikenellaceae bacterium]
MRHLSKLTLGVGVLTLSTPAFAQKTQKSKKQKQPNIVFILSDDHTSQAWGVYGGILADYVQNDNIKRLAEEGCVLDNSFCTNSISVPSRASIMTGAYSHINGVRTLSDALATDKDNIAKQLKEGGYQTAIIGKWHLKTEPQGFDYYSVFHDQGDYQNPSFKTIGAWTDDYTGGVQEQGFSTDLVTDKSLDWVEECDDDAPFALFCHFKATHEPWDYPERLAHLYDDVTFPEPHNMMEFDSTRSGRTFPGQQLENLGWRWEQASDKPGTWWCDYPELPFYVKGLYVTEARSAIYQKMIKDYLRCGAAIDDNIGRILNYLDQKGLTENTIVVYVADQGYFLGEHGFFDKRMMYEEALRMPFVIRYPREIPSGTRNDDIILNIDFAATLADYAGVSAPDESQGESFRANLAGQTPDSWRDAMYYRYWTQEKIRPAHFGIRNERYKLIFLYGDKLDATGSSDYISSPSWEFYDLERDPYEDTNRINDPYYSSVISQMKQQLIEERKKVGDTDENYPVMQQMVERYF